MKPQINNKRRFNLDKQLVQKLDSAKLAQVKAGNAAEEAGTTLWLSLITGATVSTTGSSAVTVVVVCTIADAS